VKDFIEATGLDYESNFTGLPDHVSVELEFMRKLTEWEAEKWDQRNRQRAEYCIDVQRKFLERHLLNWLPRFCEVVMQRAELPFYRSMAELTRDYMLYERVNTRNPRGDRQVAQESLELSSKLSAV
jgi:TorA maturation chaperone TorD